MKINSRDKGEEELSAQIVDLSYKEKEKACKTITKDFLYGLWNLHSSGVEWNKKNDNKNLLNIVARCSMLLAHLRAVINVWQDDFNNEFKYGSPVIEKPDRLNQLFYNLVRGHALVCGRKQIGIEDLPAVIELCVDGAPSARATLFRKLIEYSGKMTTSEIERELNCSKPTALKEMKTLEIVKICTLHEHANQDNEIKLSDRFKWFLSSECTEIRKLANKAK
ncbi:MAG: hypothetical protein NT077_01505 [Candidatus Taylorbacteria bacterium]|nr:hypothetical protein [Candidatus Taylorbacteria bacterium]